MGCTCSLKQQNSLTQEEQQDEKVDTEQDIGHSHKDIFKLRIQRTNNYFYEDRSEKIKNSKLGLADIVQSQQQITTKQYTDIKLNSSNKNSSNFLSQQKVDGKFQQLEKEQESQQKQYVNKRNSSMLEKLMESEKQQRPGQVQTEFHRKKQMFEMMIQNKQRNTVKEMSEQSGESFFSQEFILKNDRRDKVHSFVRIRAASEESKLKSILKKDLKYYNSSSSGSSTNKRVSFKFVTRICYSLKETRKNKKVVKKLKSLRQQKKFYMDEFEK